MCVRCVLYQIEYKRSSRRIALSDTGTRRHRVHSCFTDRMNRSTIAILAGSPILPYRGRMLRRLHHALKLRHQNCLPLSSDDVARMLAMCATGSVEKALHLDGRGALRKDRESHADPGKLIDRHGTQNPARVGTVVRPTCHVCPGYLATIRRRRRSD